MGRKKQAVKKHSDEYIDKQRRYKVASRATAMNWFRYFGFANPEAMAFLNSNHELVNYFFPAWSKKMRQADTDYIRDFVIANVQSIMLERALKSDKPVNFQAWFKQATDMSKFAEERGCRDSVVNVNFSAVK